MYISFNKKVIVWIYQLLKQTTLSWREITLNQNTWALSYLNCNSKSIAPHKSYLLANMILIQVIVCIYLRNSTIYQNSKDICYRIDQPAGHIEKLDA